MPALYRVFPYVAKAAAREPGGALFIPPQGGGRIDNADAYSVLYLSNAAAGATAEAFGRFPEWTASILKGPPSLTGSVRALARYRLPDDARICDLDNPEQLRKLRLRPSEVVSRDYAKTRAWARMIHGEKRWTGIAWWSYYDSRWMSLGLWDVSRLKVEEVRPLRLDDPAMQEAARTIVRVVR